MTPTEHRQQWDEQQKLYADWLKQQVAKGGCPKCGSMLHGPDESAVRLCRNCGNKFEVKKGK